MQTREGLKHVDVGCGLKLVDVCCPKIPAPSLLRPSWSKKGGLDPPGASEKHACQSGGCADGGGGAQGMKNVNSPRFGPQCYMGEIPPVDVGFPGPPGEPAKNAERRSVWALC